VSPRDPSAPLACDAAGALIDAYVLDELDQAGRLALADHVRSCAACAAELGGATRLVGLLASTPPAESSPDLDERVILAAIADRRRRHEHRSWLAGLPVLIFRGAARTTGTLVVTIVAVALLGSAFVFAVGGFIAQTAQNLPPSVTFTPEVTPTLAPTHEQTAAPAATPERGTQKPEVVAATPAPTPPPTVAATPAATPEPTSTLAPEPTPAPTPEPTALPTVSPSPSAEPTPEPTPTPTPTEKPRRTPPPSASPSPSPSVVIQSQPSSSTAPTSP
jgi:hypothetical protein